MTRDRWAGIPLLNNISKEAVRKASNNVERKVRERQAKEAKARKALGLPTRRRGASCTGLRSCVGNFRCPAHREGIKDEVSGGRK
jgi:hypothetical protein